MKNFVIILDLDKKILNSNVNNVYRWIILFSRYMRFSGCNSELNDLDEYEQCVKNLNG